ncbi:hypothetical protein ANANG_G00104820 [Anguilla anguilla]|uniref:Myotubularin phosphatase domain-containing protein n=1 Tax=Anguilla anguilla TaxID=7936 RepID=A0A9D3MHA1_ANGAN|nr:hypothetical protein ANANG_G00104820 [Anguilla anguilla]
MAQRLPLWCWNHHNGSALVRMANISDPAQQRKLDQRICNAVTKSHPKRGEVLKFDLDKALPSIQDIQAAFVRLRQICVIEPYGESEEKWLSSMESSRWLECCRAFLKHSAEVVYMLEGQQASVILKEEQGRDLSCVVSSLAQLMLDPHFRSLGGFQSLVQKEWVMAGHRFLDRCNHLKKSGKEECPLFLLFLDCVWQLLNQYPAAFEFTETYLTVLADSMWVPVFSTFLFNCPRQHAEHCRALASSKNAPLGEDRGLRFPPVWDWSQQFSPKDQTLFNSPLYVGKGAPCVQNGAVKAFRRTKKNYSSTLRGVPSPRNGLLGEHPLFPAATPWRSGSSRTRCSRGRRRRARGSTSPGTGSPGRRTCRACCCPSCCPPTCGCGGSTSCAGRRRRRSRGGPVTAFRRASQLADEIETLRLQLRQGNGSAPCPGSALSPLQPERRRMYFRAGSPATPSPPGSTSAPPSPSRPWATCAAAAARAPPSASSSAAPRSGSPPKRWPARLYEPRRPPLPPPAPASLHPYKGPQHKLSLQRGLGALGFLHFIYLFCFAGDNSLSRSNRTFS